LDSVTRFIPARVQLAHACWEVGDHQAVVHMDAEIKSIAPKYSLTHAERMFPYLVPNQRARLLDALSAVGLT
jgi:hypothetical protein